MRTLNSIKQAGFTLIELVIVIVIIGILAAAAVPLLTGVTDDANAAAADGVASAAQSAGLAEMALCQNPSKACGADGNHKATTFEPECETYLAGKIKLDTALGQSLKCDNNVCYGVSKGADGVSYTSTVKVTAGYCA